MLRTLIVTFSFSIAIAAIIGWIRYKKINPSYYPFIYCLWIGFLNELISYTVTKAGYSTAINNNIYVLIESLIVTWQFKRWGLFQRHKSLHIILLILFCVLWFVENFYISKITHIRSEFRIVYSFTIVLMSISQLNAILIREKKTILKNPIALICLGFILFYTYKVLVESFWVYGLNNSKDFRNNVYLILAYINLIANLIYALAVLWMPTKHRFSLPF
jgi:hypothetical protein